MDPDFLILMPTSGISGHAHQSAFSRGLSQLDARAVFCRHVDCILTSWRLDRFERFQTLGILNKLVTRPRRYFVWVGTHIFPACPPPWLGLPPATRYQTHGAGQISASLGMYQM